MVFHPAISSSSESTGLGLGFEGFFFTVLVSVALLKEIFWHQTKNTALGGGAPQMTLV